MSAPISSSISSHISPPFSSARDPAITTPVDTSNIFTLIDCILLGSFLALMAGAVLGVVYTTTDYLFCPRYFWLSVLLVCDLWNFRYQSI